MLILIGTNILDMELDLIDLQFFHFDGIGLGRNVKIFGIDMRSSVPIDNKKKDILILGKGPTQGLEHALLQKKCIGLILQSTIKTSV